MICVLYWQEIRTEVLSDKDEFMILACDGLWDVLTSQQVGHRWSQLLGLGPVLGCACGVWVVIQCVRCVAMGCVCTGRELRATAAVGAQRCAEGVSGAGG